MSWNGHLSNKPTSPRILNTWLLANPNQGRSHFPHNFIDNLQLEMGLSFVTNFEELKS